MLDKRLVGKWYSDEYEETINIFNEVPLRMKISFASTGYLNIEPNCVYEKNGAFCYEINDEKYRMVYCIHYESGELKGYYIQFGNKKNITYKLISKEPDDLPYEYRPIEKIVSSLDKPRFEILKLYKDYSDNTNPIKGFDYYLNETLPEVLDKYDYKNYISRYNPNDNSIVFALLDFVCDHFKHDGCNGMGNGKKLEDIIKFCEEHNMKTNCRGLAIILANLLRANGVKALHITCKPYEEPFQDCHVVVDCFLPSGERIMLDPTYRLYLRDLNGKYISLPHLREMLINKEEYTANEKASYNGGEFNLKEQREYMTKNTFRFSRQIVAKDGIDRDDIILIPKGYPTSNFSDLEKTKFVFNDIEFWSEN